MYCVAGMRGRVRSFDGVRVPGGRVRGPPVDFGEISVDPRTSLSPGPRMPSLEELLAAQRARSAAKFAPEIRAVMARATQELREQGMPSDLPRVGQAAPDFARPGLDGRSVRLRNLIRRGPVVVSFFRGRW